MAVTWSWAAPRHQPEVPQTDCQPPPLGDCGNFHLSRGEDERRCRETLWKGPSRRLLGIARHAGRHSWRTSCWVRPPGWAALKSAWAITR